MIDKYDKYLIDTFNDLNKYEKNSTNYDLFFSGYNNNENVHNVFKLTKANKKIWFMFPEYNNSIPDDNEFFECIDCKEKYDEIEFIYISSFIKKYQKLLTENVKICIDITGFVKPYLIYLLLTLQQMGLKNIDIIYTEPKIYNQQENTKFSFDETIKVRPIWKDMRVDRGKNDLLIINPGYDHKLVTNVVSDLPVKNKKILLGFPSLQPMMFQENILNLELASENMGINSSFKPLLASANDPFETAKVINNYVNEYYEKMKEKINTIYLVPLATKAQTLGFVVFYIREYERLQKLNTELKFVYPFTKSYSSNTNKELFRINRYSLTIY